MGRNISGLDRATEEFFLRQEFQLDYQPVLSLDRPQIGGFEALLHLRKHREPHYPNDFIPLIEQTSLRAPLARWVLREACRQVGYWQERDGTDSISVSVNLSTRQLRQGTDLIYQLESVLAETGLSPNHLQLEIPQGAMQQVQAITPTLTSLKSLGIQLYLDNFMPSYSALEVLPKMPIDAVKICHSALNDLNHVVDHLESTLHFANDLGVQVIAKKIETLLQLEQLKACGFRYGQGFLFAKPVTSREAALLVATTHKNNVVEFNLATHLLTMNKLSQFLHHLLGLIVVKYWRETKPNKAWLSPLTPMGTGDIVSAENMPVLVDLLQQQDLHNWVQDCLRHCRKIFPQLSKMLRESSLSLNEQALLGLA